MVNWLWYVINIITLTMFSYKFIWHWFIIWIVCYWRWAITNLDLIWSSSIRTSHDVLSSTWVNLLHFNFIFSMFFILLWRETRKLVLLWFLIYFKIIGQSINPFNNWRVIIMINSLLRFKSCMLISWTLHEIIILSFASCLIKLYLLEILRMISQSLLNWYVGPM